MAPKKALPPPPPSPEPDEEEEEEEGEETSDEEDEESEEESDFSEDEETTPLQFSEINKTGCPKVSDFASKPISQAKRSFDDGKESRNGKKVKTDEGEEKKEKDLAFSATGGVGMVSRGEERIILSQRMIDYKDKNGTDPYTDTDIHAFHEFIKRKLHADISKNQLSEKLRRLKQNYFAIVEKENNGEKHVFSGPYQSKVFELSKKLWGNDDRKIDYQIGRPIDRNGKESHKHNSNMDGIIDEEEDFESKYPFLSQSFHVEGLSSIPPGMLRFMKRNLAVLGHVQARDLDEKWKKIRRGEAEILLKKLTLMKRMVELILEADKKTGN